MAGRGRAPKDPSERRNTTAPIRGEMEAVPGVGWQHGAVPDVPDGLMAASVTAWSTWFGAWFAAHWGPEDVPGLRQLIRVYDQVERGEFQRAGELRLGMDTFGISPKGQQDRRWKKPEAEVAAPAVSSSGRYQHLRPA